MNEVKILACPCSGEPELIEENTDMNLSLKGVRCKKCGETIPVIHVLAPDAVQAWNDWAAPATQSTKSQTPETDEIDLRDITPQSVGTSISFRVAALRDKSRSLELRLNAALAENEELRKDKAIVDFLHEFGQVSFSPDTISRTHLPRYNISVLVPEAHIDIRQAIDSAISPPTNHQHLKVNETKTPCEYNLQST